MAEAGDVVTSAPESDTAKPNRRRVLGGIAALTASAVATSLGLRPPELLSNKDNSIRLIFGSHNLPEGYGGNLQKAVIDPYVKHGDLEVCTWPSGPQKIIDQGMRKAKQRGKSIYMLGVDGNEAYIPLYESPNNYPLYPHPNLFEKEAYPDRIIMINTEAPYDFGLGLLNFKEEVMVELVDFENELLNEYDPYNPERSNETSQQDIKNFLAATGETVVAIPAAMKGAHMLGRRSFLTAGAVAAATGPQVVKNLIGAGVTSDVIGKSSSYSEQQALTQVQSVTGQPPLFGDYFDQWVKVRTAMAIEKAIDAQNDVGNDNNLKPQEIPVDLLYGSMHTTDAPKIKSSQEYRKQVIQSGVRELLRRVDTMINGKYKTLASDNGYGQTYRDKIIAMIASSLTLYSYGDVHYPWGIEKIEPSQISKFEESLIPKITLKRSDTITDWIGDVVKEFGLTQDDLFLDGFKPQLH